jgi:hypothetical protein
VSNPAVALRIRRGNVDAVLVGVHAHEQSARFLLVRLLADSQGPGSPSARCIGVTLQASRLQPAVLHRTGHPSSRSHLVQASQEEHRAGLKNSSQTG